MWAAGDLNHLLVLAATLSPASPRKTLPWKPFTMLNQNDQNKRCFLIKSRLLSPSLQAVASGYCRDSELVEVLMINKPECSAVDESTIFTSFHPKLRGCGTVVSGRDVAAAYISSQQMWLSARDQARQKSNMMGEGTLRSQPFWKAC